MAKHKDLIPGGLADRSKPGDFSKKQLKMGTSVEREHVGKKTSMAREIAMDHLKEFPKYYTALKRMEKGLEKSKNEAAMDIGYFVSMLEDLRYELCEGAAPPPFKAGERQKAGLRPLPTRRGAQPPPIPLRSKKVDPDSEVGKALHHIKKMNRSETDKALDTVRELNKKKAEQPKPQPSKKEMVAKAMAKPQGAYPKNKFGTKGLGITRSMSGGGAGGEFLKNAVARRKAHGESLSRTASAIRGIFEAEERGRYGGGSPLNPREQRAKYGTEKWKSNLSAKMKAKHR